MAKKKANEYKLPPEEYRTILKQVELEAISLEDCSAKIRRDKLNKSAEVAVTDRLSHKVQGKNMVEIDHHYELIAGSGTKKDFALKIICVFKLRYSSESGLSEDFINIFKERNVPLNTWPYFREFVQNMTQRMNIPPLTLPLLK